ncbi:response regulator receiver domain [Rhizobium johnstonii]|uniref:response regulator receiver domain n=1 Tax=Rhizobium TaxID=379 RepID=UPI001031619F|nr:response regulator receiver domain [Rhizobium leguminosarum]TBH48348.1 hypothetical protein ELG62_31650 [Rhizobium leguminosarum]
MTFEEQCSQAASRFLQTAVLVDDRAEFAHGEHEVGDLEDPSDLAAADAPAAMAAAPAPKEDLDAGAITKGFADKGLICSVLKPSPGERTVTADVLRLAPRSDMIVVDWQIGDNGEIALNIVGKVLEIDKRSGGRLRLFAVYTGVRDLQTVADRIGLDIASLQVGANPFEFVNDSSTAKLVILGKGVAADHEAGQEGRCVEEGDLAERLISEFATFSGGILRNATLASMGHLRSNTHRLLARLNSSLDAPLVTHFALVESSQDAQQYVADLILQEIEAQLPLDEIVARFAGPASIKARISKTYRDGKSSQVVIDEENGVVHDIPEATAQILIESPLAALKPHFKAFGTALGKKQGEIANQFTPDSVAKRLYPVLGDNIADGIQQHEHFAIASGVRLANGASDFRYRQLPIVRLGTVIHDGDNYFLCLTPVCDSVRLKGGKARFVFGRLDEDADKFNLIVDDEGDRKRLLIDRKDLFLKTFELRPGYDEVVRVERKREFLEFAIPLAEGGEYVRWVAEMKPMQAQRVVGSITSNLSRIGLDEFEWLRQLAENWSG